MKNKNRLNGALAFLLTQAVPGIENADNHEQVETTLNNLIPRMLESDHSADSPFAGIITTAFREIKLFPAKYLVCGKGSGEVGTRLAKEKDLILTQEDNGEFYYQNDADKRVYLNKDDRVIVFVTCVTNGKILSPLVKSLISVACPVEVCCFFYYDNCGVKTSMQGLDIQMTSIINYDEVKEMDENVNAQPITNLVA